MVGLETAFGVCYTKLCREQRIPLEMLSFLMSAGPAAVLGLADHKACWNRLRCRYRAGGYRPYV